MQPRGKGGEAMMSNRGYWVFRVCSVHKQIENPVPRRTLVAALTVLRRQHNDHLLSLEDAVAVAKYLCGTPGGGSFAAVAVQAEEIFTKTEEATTSKSVLRPVN